MTRSRLIAAIAHATGEDHRTLRRRGFSLARSRSDDLEPEDLILVLDCPFCGRPVPYASHGRHRPCATAECDRCDVDFEFQPEEVYAAEATAHGHQPGHTVPAPS